MAHRLKLLVRLQRLVARLEQLLLLVELEDDVQKLGWHTNEGGREREQVGELRRIDSDRWDLDVGHRKLQQLR